MADTDRTFVEQVQELLDRIQQMREHPETVTREDLDELEQEALTLAASRP